MNNATKAWSFLALLSLTLIVLGQVLGGREGLLISLVLALGINSFVYFYEDIRVLNLFSGHTVEGQDPYGVADIIRRLAIHARIPAPKIVLLQDQAPQAFVVGRGVTHGTIILTEGLLRRFNPREIEAILAYQISCIKNLNTLAFAVGSFLVGSILLVAELIDGFLRLILVEKKNPNSPVSQIFTRVVSPLAGLILKISIRPSLYFAADQGATHLTHDAKSLAQVLWKLETLSHTLPFHAPASAGHMFIVNPLTIFRHTRYFHAQPATPERIQRLVGYYPI